MKFFDDNKNASDAQIQSGCGSIIFDITKAAAKPNLIEFFGDADILSCDTVSVRLMGPKGPQVLVNDLPLFRLMLSATTGPNHMKCYLNAGGNITRVVGEIQLGVGGALALGTGDTYLSVKTNVSGLSNLKMYSFDGFKTNLAYQYEVVKLDSFVTRSFSLDNINKLILSKHVSSLQLSKVMTDGGSALKGEHVVELDGEEIESAARGLNDIAGVMGEAVSYNLSILGQTVPTTGGIISKQFFSGGTYYDVLGVADFSICKIQSKVNDFVFLSRVFDTTI
jgi:hypothetical protein